MEGSVLGRDLSVCIPFNPPRMPVHPFEVTANGTEMEFGCLAAGGSIGTKIGHMILHSILICVQIREGTHITPDQF